MTWPTVALEEVCQLSYGKSLRGYLPEPRPEHVTRVYGTNGPIGWARAALTDVPTVVVGRKGAYRGVHYATGPSWTIDTAYFTEVDANRLDLKWFYYRLLLVDINGMNSGAAIPSTRREDFYSITIKLPDLSSQQRIAATLSAYDDLIENNRKRIALLEEAARLLYREWCVHLRFPGHEHVRIVGGVPNGWQRVELGRVLTLKRGYDLPAARRAPGPVPVVSSSGVTGCHNQAKARGPGVVTGRYGTLGEVYFVETEYWPLNTALYVSDFKGHDPFFVFQMLKSLLRGVGTQKAAVPGVDRNVLHTMPVVWPSAALRQAFVESVRDNQRQIRVLTAMNDKLAEARDLLLPRLMSGEITV